MVSLILARKKGYAVTAACPLFRTLSCTYELNSRMINELEKQKISIITPSLSGGGAEKVAVNLANHFVSIGNEVDLVVFKLTGPYQSLINPGVNIVDLNVSRTRYVFFKMRCYLKENRNSLVLSVIRDANFFVGLAAIALRQKSLTFREANTLDAVLSKSTPSRFIYLSLMKLAYFRANNIIANSDDTKSDLVNNRITNKDKVSVIRNPVLALNYEKLKTFQVNEDWFERNDLKVLLSVGRLHPQKNFQFLISVFNDVYKQDKNTRLMIVGDGDEKDNLLAKIKVKEDDLTEVVKLVEFQNNIYPYYKNADVFALTSDWEGFGNVLVEALSVGLPVVSTNCPGGPKMILENGKYGQLVPLGDKQAYVDALLKVLRKPEKSQESIDYAKGFTVERVAKDYLMIMTSNNDVL